VISNLVLHCFTEAGVRRIADEVERCLRAGGLLMFHVHSTHDLERRLAVQPPECQLGLHCFVLAGGQTMRFFSGDDCAALLAGWSLIAMEPMTTTDLHGHPVKSVWRCAARKRS